MKTSEELGKLIQYYYDTSEKGGDGYIICKLNDVLDEVIELEKTQSRLVSIIEDDLYDCVSSDYQEYVDKELNKLGV